MNCALDSVSLYNSVNNCGQYVHNLYSNSNNIEHEGIQDIGFTPDSPHAKDTTFTTAFVNFNEVSDKANMYIDKVDFFYDGGYQGSIFPRYLVFLHGVNDPNKRGFYYASLDINNTVTLYTCEEVPLGHLQVLFSEVMYVYHFVHSHFDFLTDEECCRAKIVYRNWKKDVFTEETLGMSYCEYIVDIIDKLILRQETVLHNHQSCSMKADDAKTVSNICTNTVSQVPCFIEDVLSQNVDCNEKYCDPNFPNKAKGFINHSSADFTFIGPDRRPVHIDTVEKCIEIADVIRQTGVPNYQTARIPLRSGLNIEAWEHLLSEYPDKFLIQYLKFGFPLSISNHDNLKISNVTNHYSAIQYPQAVQDYISKELGHGALLGPVNCIQSPHFHCSPLLTRPKDEDKRRIILNLSHPQGASLNDNVDKTNFDNRPFSLKLVTIDDIVQEVLALNRPLIFKIDVSRAFRNLRVDPVDVLKLGISWDGSYYLDSAIAFGWTHGTCAFQMVADAIAHIMSTGGGKVLPYVDDFVVVAEEDIAQGLFDDLANLFTEVGLPMNPDKIVPPCTSVTCLGIIIDIFNNTLSIDHNKLSSIYHECTRVRTKKYLTTKSYQSLLGKLIYIHKCVIPARTFINRILALYRENSHKKRIRLTADFMADIEWFITFLPHFNGVTFFKKVPISDNHTLHLDASLTGMGAVWSNRVYSTPVFQIPNFELKIVHLEMLNIVIALRAWGKYWKHSQVHIHCDNMAVVQVVTSSRTKDKFLAACIRNIWLISSILDIDIVIHHIQGKKNVIADCLSRLNSCNHIDKNLVTHLESSYVWDNINIKNFSLNLTI